MKILAALSLYYSKKNKLLLRSIIVNSVYDVKENWTYDNWDGGTYGHALYFHVPTAIYHEAMDSLGDIASELCTDINKLANVQNESIAR